MRDINGRNAVPRRELEAKGVKVVELDVTDQASIDKAAAQILAEAGNIDLLVNNAGTAHMGIAEAHTPESVERQFATNFFWSGANKSCISTKHARSKKRTRCFCKFSRGALRHTFHWNIYRVEVCAGSAS